MSGEGKFTHPRDLVSGSEARRMYADALRPAPKVALPVVRYPEGRPHASTCTPAGMRSRPGAASTGARTPLPR